MLKQDYKEGDMTLSSALALAVKVLNKTMDVSKLSAEKGEWDVERCTLWPIVAAVVCFTVTEYETSLAKI